MTRRQNLCLQLLFVRTDCILQAYGKPRPSDQQPVESSQISSAPLKTLKETTAKPPSSEGSAEPEAPS